MSATVLQFPSRNRVTGEALLHARRYQETHAEMRRAFAAERFFKEEWLPAFEAECQLDPDFALHMGLI